MRLKFGLAIFVLLLLLLGCTNSVQERSFAPTDTSTSTSQSNLPAPSPSVTQIPSPTPTPPPSPSPSQESLPPTPTQFEVPIVFSEAEGHPIVFDSFLLGGSHEQKWIDNVEAAQKIKGGEVYKLYDNTGYIGLGIGSSVPIYDIGPYAEFIDVTHENENFYQLAISADWDAMPRKMLPIEDVEPIRKILADYLVGQKGLNTKIVVSQCYSIDFAGNGVQRVVVSANSINTDYYEIFAGDFSLVAVIDPDKKITILFEDIWYEGIDEWRGETRRFANISSVADLNGDGVMEFIMKWEYYEGIVYEAYSIYNSETTLVLINGLGA